MRLTIYLLVFFIFTVAIDQIANQVQISVKRGKRTESSTPRKTLVQARHGLSKKLSVRLTNVENIYYYGTVSVGTPAKKFLIHFDTGSSDMWVYSSKCTLQACKPHARYNSTASKTSSKDGKSFAIIYGDGSFVEGTTVYDTIRIGNLEIKKQGFAQISYAFGMDGEKPDGIMGLGFKALATSKFATPIDNAFAQKKLPNKIISFWMNRDLKSSEGGSLTIGGIDKTRYTGWLSFFIRKQKLKHI